MIDRNTDFFKIDDNFAKTAHIPSIPIVQAKLDFVPKVTIAIPTFKRPILLREALDSALNQTNFSDYEIIVVDNNPERGCETEKLISSYSEKRLSYYKNSENLGMVANWNRCYELAKGEWVVMLHDDDLLYSHYLKTMYDFLNKFDNNIDAIYPSINIFDNRISNQTRKPKYCKKIVYRKLKYTDFLWGNIVGTPTGMFVKKNSLLDIGGFNDSYYPSFDFAFNVYFSYYYNSIKIWNNDMCIYRISENESLKKETLINFVIKDRLIKKTIVKQSKKKPILWHCYIDIFSLYYLNMMQKIFNIKDLDKRHIENKLNLNNNLINSICYRLFNLYKKIDFRIHKNKLTLK